MNRDTGPLTDEAAGAKEFARDLVQSRGDRASLLVHSEREPPYRFPILPEKETQPGRQQKKKRDG